MQYSSCLNTWYMTTLIYLEFYLDGGNSKQLLCDHNSLLSHQAESAKRINLICRVWDSFDPIHLDSYESVKSIIWTDLKLTPSWLRKIWVNLQTIEIVSIPPGLGMMPTVHGIETDLYWRKESNDLERHWRRLGSMGVPVSGASEGKCAPTIVCTKNSYSCTNQTRSRLKIDIFTQFLYSIWALN